MTSDHDDDQEHDVTDTDRCAAAHPEDPTPCDDGPHDAVLIRDRQMSRTRDAMTEGVPGCEHHGSRMLASIDGGRVHPGTVDGAATRVRAAADSTRPFCWYETAPRTEPSQRSHAENRTAS